MANPRDPMTNQQYYTPGLPHYMRPGSHGEAAQQPPNPLAAFSASAKLASASSSSPGTSSGNQAAVPRRQRIPRACDTCRRKKIRCNLTQMPLGEDDPEDDEDEDEQNGRQYERSSVAYRPQTANGPPLPPRKPRECVNCLQAGLVCTFTKSAAKRGPNTGYIQHLETRLAALESSVNGEDISKQTKLEQRRPMTGGSILSIHDPKKRSRSTSVNAEPAPSLGDAGYGALLGGTPAGPVSERMIPDGTAGSIALQSRNISSPAPALKESQTPLHHHIAKKQRLSGKLPPILTTVYQHSSHVSGQISGHFPGDVPSTSTDTLQLATTVPRQVDTSPSGVTSNRTASPERKYRHYERPVSGSGVSQSSTDVTIRESPATHTYDYHARPSGPVYASRPSPRDPEHRKATLPPISKLLSEIPPEPLLPPRQHAPPDHARYRPLSAHPIPSVAGQPSVSPPGYAVRQPEQHFAYASTGSVDGSSRSEGNHDTRSSANHRMHSLSGSSSLTAAGPSARTSPESTHKTRGYATSDRSIVKRPSRELHQTNPSISTRGKPLDDPRQSHNQASIRYSGEGGRMMVDRDHDSTHLRRELFSTPAMRTFALLPLQRLHSGFSGCRTLIRAGKLLISPGNRIPNDSWLAQQCEIIGSAMLPSNTSTSNSDAVPEQVETLLLCYVDAVRRGKNISGVLGAISGKLTVLQSREVDIKRYNAVLTLLAIWHTTSLLSRKMYPAAPTIADPELLYEALEQEDPVIRCICYTTFALDRMCRRYVENNQQQIAAETLELALPLAITAQLPLAQQQLQLLAVLDSFVLLLNFLFNRYTDAAMPFEILDHQRHNIYNIINEFSISGVSELFIGPHVLCTAAVATIYCIAFCRSWLTDDRPTHNKIYHGLYKEYMSTLDLLKQLAIALTARSDSGDYVSDMWHLYDSILRYIRVHIAAAIFSKPDFLNSQAIVAKYVELGYMGLVLENADQ